MHPETCYIVDIGKHERRSIGPLTKLLDPIDIRGRSIFTEANDSEAKHKHPFYGRLSKYLCDRGVIEVHEVDYEISMRKASLIFKETLPEVLRQLAESKFGWQPDTKREQFDRLTQMICQIRDPLIAQHIIDATPLYSIFGAGHIPGVLSVLKNQSTINIEVLHLF